MTKGIGGASITTSTDGGGGGGTPTIFGAATKAFGAELLGISAESEVKGEETGIVGSQACQDNYYRWWLPLAIEVGFLAVYLYWLTKKRIRTKRWFIIPLVVAATSQIVHEILGCNCSTGYWCSKYIFINLIILAILLAANHLRKRSNRVAIYSIFKREQNRVTSPYGILESVVACQEALARLS